MDSQQVLRLLRAIPLFADLEDGEVMDVMRMSTPVEFGPGEAICRQGEPGDCMFVIQAGQASVLVRGGGGAAVPVAQLGAGDLIGEMTLIDAEPRSADVVASDRVRAFRIDRARFEAFRAQLHPAAFKVVRRIGLTVCGRLRHVNESVSRLIGGGADGDGQARAAANVRTRTGASAQGEARQDTRSFWTGLLGRVKGG